jgi:hypothetical protein
MEGVMIGGTQTGSLPLTSLIISAKSDRVMTTEEIHKKKGQKK